MRKTASFPVVILVVEHFAVTGLVILVKTDGLKAF